MSLSLDHGAESFCEDGEVATKGEMQWQRSVIEKKPRTQQKGQHKKSRHPKSWASLK